MIPYIAFGVLAFFFWLYITFNLIDDAFRTRNPQDIKYARMAILSFFLLPLYPALIVIALIVGPIKIFRSLGRINKEEA